MSNQNNSELIRQKFGNALWQAFAAEGKTEIECSHYDDRYSALTDTGMTPENAFMIIFQSQGATNGRDMLNQASRYVYDSLSDFNKFAPKVKLSSKTRLADTIEKFNKSVSKFASLEVNGIALTPKEIEALKIPALSNVSSESFASEKSSKVKGLSLEITK